MLHEESSNLLVNQCSNKNNLLQISPNAQEPGSFCRFFFQHLAWKLGISQREIPLNRGFKMINLALWPGQILFWSHVKPPWSVQKFKYFTIFSTVLHKVSKKIAHHGLVKWKNRHVLSLFQHLKPPCVHCHRSWQRRPSRNPKRKQRWPRSHA